MTAQIVKLETDYYGDLPPDVILQGAIDSKLRTATVVGIDQNGELYLACSDGSAAQNVFLLQRAIIMLCNLAERAEPIE